MGGEDGGGEDGEGAWPTRGKIPFPSQNRDILPDIPHNRHVWVPSLFPFTSDRLFLSAETISSRFEKLSVRVAPYSDRLDMTI